MLLVTTWACKIWIYHITNWIEKSLFEILWEISSSTCHAFFLNPRQSYPCKEHANSLKQPRQSLNPRSLFFEVQTAKHLLEFGWFGCLFRRRRKRLATNRKLKELNKFWWLATTYYLFLSRSWFDWNWTWKKVHEARAAVTTQTQYLDLWPWPTC